MPNWHADFRNVESLPDVKAIRTDFLINIVAITAALAVVGMLIFNEVTLMALNSDQKTLQEQIANRSATDRENLKLSGEFNRASNTVKELVAFSGNEIPPGPFLLDVASVTSRKMVIDTVAVALRSRKQGRNSIYFREIKFEGTIQSPAAAEATGIVDTFINDVTSFEYLSDKVDPENPPKLDRFSQDPVLGIFNYTITITLQPLNYKAPPAKPGA